VEAQARTDARSDHAVLDLFVSFCIKAKRKNKEIIFQTHLIGSVFNTLLPKLIWFLAGVNVPCFVSMAAYI
jgi:hypothetical protein